MNVFFGGLFLIIFIWLVSLDQELSKLKTNWNRYLVGAKDLERVESELERLKDLFKSVQEIKRDRLPRRTQ